MLKWLLVLGLLLLVALAVWGKRAGRSKAQLAEALGAMPGGLAPGAELLRLSAPVDLGQGPVDVEILAARLDDPETAQPDRRPFLFVHATPGTLRSWARLALVPGGLREQLAGHPLYAVEVLGHGLAEGEAAAYSFQLCADHLRAGIEALDLREVILVGHSYGGEVALRAALDAPQRLSGLVLVDSSGIERRPDEFLPEEVKMREWSVAKLGYLLNSRERVGGAFAPHFQGPPPAELVDEGYLSLDNPTNWRAMVDLCRDENGHSQAELPELALPTLLIWGELDLAYPPERFAQAFLDGLPQARLEVLPGTGHYPMEERPEAFCTALARFAQELAGPD